MSDVIGEEDMQEIVDDVEPGEQLRVHFVTNLPHQSALQPEEQIIDRLDDGRFRAKTFAGTPNHYDVDELVEELLSLDHIKAVEVPA